MGSQQMKCGESSRALGIGKSGFKKQPINRRGRRADAIANCLLRALRRPLRLILSRIAMIE